MREQKCIHHIQMIQPFSEALCIVFLLLPFCSIMCNTVQFYGDSTQITDQHLRQSKKLHQRMWARWSLLESLKDPAKTLSMCRVHLSCASSWEMSSLDRFCTEVLELTQLERESCAIQTIAGSLLWEYLCQFLT